VTRSAQQSAQFTLAKLQHAKITSSGIWSKVLISETSVLIILQAELLKGKHNIRTPLIGHKLQLTFFYFVNSTHIYKHQFMTILLLHKYYSYIKEHPNANNQKRITRKESPHPDGIFKISPHLIRRDLCCIWIECGTILLAPCATQVHWNFLTLWRVAKWDCMIIMPQKIRKCTTNEPSTMWIQLIMLQVSQTPQVTLTGILLNHWAFFLFTYAKQKGLEIFLL
jgi:hypothetical protein